MKYQLLAISCLMAAVRSRRHLCDDLTLPDCPAGTHGPSQKADYNPTGENRWRKNIENIEKKNIGKTFEKHRKKHLKKHWKKIETPPERTGGEKTLLISIEIILQATSLSEWSNAHLPRRL